MILSDAVVRYESAPSGRDQPPPGVIRSKDAAADWVLERLPEAYRPVIARARAVYLGDQAEQWEDIGNQIRPWADYVIRKINELLES